MPLIKNLNAATGADFVGSETTPTLAISNLSTGRALDVVGNSTSTANPALQVRFNANVAGATVAPLNIVASTASQAFLSFSGVFLSSASYGGTASTNAFVIPVYHESQRVFGYVSAQKALV